MNLTPGGSVTAINANGWTPLPSGTENVQGDLRPTPHIRRSASAAASPTTAAPDSLPPNTFIVVQRGTCARVAKAIFGQQAGAAGVIMINNAPGYPPYEGPITGDPDPPGPPLFGGFSYSVTIPFLGVPSGQGPTLIAADNGTLTLSATDAHEPRLRVARELLVLWSAVG